MCCSSVGPVQAESVQLAVVGVCDVPALRGGDVVRELPAGAADGRTGPLLAHARPAQLDVQRQVTPSTPFMVSHSRSCDHVQPAPSNFFFKF